MPIKGVNMLCIEKEWWDVGVRLQEEMNLLLTYFDNFGVTLSIAM